MAPCASDVTTCVKCGIPSGKTVRYVRVPDCVKERPKFRDYLMVGCTACGYEEPKPCADAVIK